MANVPPVEHWFKEDGKPSDAYHRFHSDTRDEINALDDVAAKLNVEGQVLTGGVTVTSKDLGTIATGTLTLDLGDRPQQHYVNGGAHTLAPGSVTGSCLLDITNNASAGAVTTSGWTMVVGAFSTTDGDAFRCHASVGNAGSLLIIQEMQ